MKTDALLLDEGVNGEPALKLSYFGYAKRDNSVAMTTATPILFAAPEVLGYDVYDAKVRLQTFTLTSEFAVPNPRNMLTRAPTKGV